MSTVQEPPIGHTYCLRLGADSHRKPYGLTMPSDESRPPYVSEAGSGSPIDVARVRSALADWKRIERSGSPSQRKAAARQVKLCEAMLQAAEDE